MKTHLSSNMLTYLYTIPVTRKSEYPHLLTYLFTHVSFYDVFRNIWCHIISDLWNDKLAWLWKEEIGPKSRYDPTIHLEELNKPMKNFSHDGLLPHKNQNHVESATTKPICLSSTCYRFTEWQSAARLEALLRTVLCRVARFIWHNLAAGFNRNAVLCIVRQVLYRYLCLPIHHMPEAVLQLDRCSNTFPRVQVHIPFSLLWVPADRTSSHRITSKIKI